jgi:hypothetical protein
LAPLVLKVQFSIGNSSVNEGAAVAAEAIATSSSVAADPRLTSVWFMWLSLVQAEQTDPPAKVFSRSGV